jgi:hypothetical protein
VETLVDGIYGNGGRGGRRMGTSTMVGCNGIDGVAGWLVGVATEDA